MSSPRSSKSPSPPGFLKALPRPRLEDILKSTGFRLVFFILVFAFLFNLATSLKLTDELRKAEYLLLDTRVRLRQARQVPDENIVLVGKDRNTDQFARSHPELGIKGGALPRKRLAQIINYLSDQGAKAIILDVEFKDPTTPENDQALAKAIQKAGNVYLAVDFPGKLEETLLQKDPNYGKHAYQIYHDITLNHLQQGLMSLSLINSFVRGQPSGPFSSPQGLIFLFLESPENTEREPITSILQIFQEDILTAPHNAGVLQSGPLARTSLMDYLLFPKRIQHAVAPLNAPQEEILNVLETVCTVQRFQDTFAKQPEYLAYLKKFSLPVEITINKNAAFLPAITRCSAEPILGAFIQHAKGIGVVSVDYYAEGYLREIPVLYRAYQDNFFTYLGIRPALDILKPSKIQLNDHSLTLTLRSGETREIYLDAEGDLLINWKNPELLMQRRVNRYHQEKTYQTIRQWMGQKFPQMMPHPVNPFVPFKPQRPYTLFEAVNPYTTDPAVEKHCDSECQSQLNETLYMEKKLQNPNPLMSLFSGTLQDPGPWLEDIRRDLLNQELSRHPKEFSNLIKRNWLGGGDIYRMVAAIDIIKKVEMDSDPLKAQKQAYQELDTLQEWVGNKESGLFSFKDKIVIYGDTIKDIHRTPVSEAMHGPEVVASVVDMILNDKVFIQQINDGRIYGLIIAMMLFIVYRVTRPQASLFAENIIGVLTLSGYWVFNVASFVLMGWWFPLVIPSLLLFSTLMISDIYRYWIQDKEKRQLTNVFANYVSPQVMEEILKSPEKAMDNLKGSKKELTVLFTDIKNFTATFESEDPEKMVEQLNEYFDAMIEIILRHDGTIDKFMGDAIMAFFGAPHPLENHAEIACHTALEMKDALEALNTKWREAGKKELDHGIGLATGMMFVGNFGSQNNKDFTVMGSVVNLGARLETYTREVDADIIISEKTFQILERKISTRNLGHVHVKGFREPVQIYSLEGFVGEGFVASPETPTA